MALMTGLIFFAGSTTSLAAVSNRTGSKKQSWKKPRANKSKG